MTYKRRFLSFFFLFLISYLFHIEQSRQYILSFRSSRKKSNTHLVHVTFTDRNPRALTRDIHDDLEDSIIHTILKSSKKI